MTHSPVAYSNLASVALDRVRLLRTVAITVRRRATATQVDLAVLGFDSQAPADNAVAAINDAKQASRVLYSTHNEPINVAMECS
jgi:hypothetical protein